MLMYSLGAIIVVPFIGPLIAYISRSVSGGKPLDSKRLEACRVQIDNYNKKKSTSKAVVDACHSDLYDEKLDLAGVYKISLAAVIGCILIAWLVIWAKNAHGHSKVYALQHSTEIGAAHTRGLNDAASVQNQLKGPEQQKLQRTAFENVSNFKSSRGPAMFSGSPGVGVEDK